APVPTFTPVAAFSTFPAFALPRAAFAALPAPIGASLASLPTAAIAAGAALRGRRGAGLALGFAEEDPPRQLDAVVFIDGDDLDRQLVAHLAHILDLADELVVQLADVAQPFLAGQDLDEGAKVLDRGDAAFVDLADLNLLANGFDLAHGSLGALGVGMRHVHGAVVLDVDLGAGRFLDALDHLAARTDQGADLLGVDLDG